jgi:Zn-dependent peptidase ImmA (M78 family)
MNTLFFSKHVLESVATKTLNLYKPNYFDLPPQAVPIEQLIENTFDLNIEYQYLTNNGRELGRTIFDDGYTPYYIMEKHCYSLLQVCSGTIMIDASLLSENKYRCLRFTLAHELAHFLVHKKIYSNKSATIYHKNEDSIYKWNEWQADFLATAILMPADQIKRCFYNLYSQYKSNSVIIAEMSVIFSVSKTAMHIRLENRGLITKEQ